MPPVVAPMTSTCSDGASATLAECGTDNVWSQGSCKCPEWTSGVVASTPAPSNSQATLLGGSDENDYYNSQSVFFSPSSSAPESATRNATITAYDAVSRRLSFRPLDATVIGSSAYGICKCPSWTSWTHGVCDILYETGCEPELLVFGTDTVALRIP